jgi:hypothetical protein
MTDTPDALKTNEAMRRRCRELTREGDADDYDRVVAMVLDDFETIAKQRDAAIKRVAELEKENADYCEQINVIDDQLDDYKESCGIEIERLQVALVTVAIPLEAIVGAQTQKFHSAEVALSINKAVETIRAALAPKETNNG